MKRILLAAVVALAAGSMRAEVSLPQILSDHMVVQREMPVHVWGMAEPGEAVTAAFRGEKLSVKADEVGKWSLYFHPGEAGGPFVLTVDGKNHLQIADILVGDLWVASGQSNMEFELRRSSTAAEALASAANDKIRLLHVKKRASEFAEENLQDEKWSASSADSAAEFSAVAWYFAREIQAHEGVPVGVIDATWGGTLAESWTRLGAIAEDASLMPLFQSRAKMTDGELEAFRQDTYQKQLKSEAHAKGEKEPQFPWHPPLAMWAPGLLYNGMIAPLTPMGIRGVIWYQGESNSALARAPLYGRIFRTMIEDWRRQWQQGDFPFLYVQIANFKSTPLEDWAPVREAQRKALMLRNTAMAVTIDLGNPDDVHPTNKIEVGRRLSLAARNLSYGEKIESSGPLFRQMSTESGAIRLWFDHATGLHAKGDTLSAFEVAGKDGKYFAASAQIEGSTVVVKSDKVANPVTARYGWSNSPECNLYNGEGLPASPFSAER